MQRHKVFIIFLCLIAKFASAQTITRRGVATSHQYSSEKSICYLNQYKTSYEVMRLFRSEEIVVIMERSPFVSMDTMILKIQVNDTSHVVLQYFKYRASILTDGKKFPFNSFPHLNSAVSGLSYHASPGHKADLLKISLGEGKPNLHPIHPIQYQLFFDLDGKVYSSDEYRELSFSKIPKILSEISGKEAVQKYGDQKYFVGVHIVTTKE